MLYVVVVTNRFLNIYKLIIYPELCSWDPTVQKSSTYFYLPLISISISQKC